MSEDERFKRTLETEMEAKGFNMKSLSLAAGLGDTFVRDVLRRDRKPSLEAVQKLAKVLGRSVDYLTNAGREVVPPGKEFPEDPVFDEGISDAAARKERRQLQPGEVVERDVVGGLGAGGYGQVILVDGKQVDAGRAIWQFPVDYLRTELRARESDVDIVAVDGDSMAPTLLPGDRVMINRSQTAPSDGLYAIDNGVGIVIKRLEVVMGSDPLQIAVLSDNPNHRAQNILADDLRVIGRVIMRVTRM
ncbi:hypothetical protein GCM10007276_12050 [Agaricicola taiwanensis]|uniref:HTH cro/C1-type domain-containing protein n=1 Tax=Agaricicola taiwanensis TaxID=591372 RepID=A0A8J2VLG4_9RHOB|nr:S24 family peptidase [Agaricicola taiwanensis]GGE36178.1 hypothetical protein GCM10007276_12050 [Agaricicola taiwanensis]